MIILLSLVYVKEPNMIVVVVDTESTALDELAGILSLSAIRTNVADMSCIKHLIGVHQAGKTHDDIFHAVLNLNEQYVMGRTFLQSTQDWWMKKTTPAAKASVTGPTQSAKDALTAFVVFIEKAIEATINERGEKAKVQLYYRGDFDAKAIASLAKAVGVELPYIFNQNKEIRTYIDAKLDTDIGYIPWLGYPEGLGRHSSLDDVLIDGFEMAVAYRINHLEKFDKKSVPGEIAKLKETYPVPEKTHAKSK
ncbi:putative exodeoxyribonuclease VIII [Erwinia phage vB_EamM_Simmy50]|uniref:Putative exodeoxyribonuclease VIII n=1 Tax=Erwinia phage vB_EamM_Simmy50 TaxID=1815988 RepID=A0A173GDQ7_9CAUD|nr:exonuclease [Erwinia phage vB_EamM_Simmy50]ANH51529.2 putative exodeoxyribonuclease VIII [Erwinia phage vB_EamM_Simmy50]